MSDNEQQPEQQQEQEQEHVEPKPETGAIHVSLRIAGIGFPELTIKVKRTTKLSKMMGAYCTRAGKKTSEVRFLFDGVKLKPEQTIEELDVDDDEEEIQIEVAAEAVGGSL